MAAVDERGKAPVQIGSYILKVRAIHVSIESMGWHDDALTQVRSSLGLGDDRLGRQGKSKDPCCRQTKNAAPVHCYSPDVATVRNSWLDQERRIGPLCNVSALPP